MKKVLTKLLCLTMAVGMSVSILASCGGGEDPAAGKTKVIFWSPQFSETETHVWLQKYTNLYNETNEKNTYIELSIIPEDVWDQKLKAAQENGTAPEIIFVNYAEIPSKAMLGNYTALDEYMSPEVWDDLSENVQEMVEVQGKHYVYPAFVEPYSMLFYSKSAFEEAGLDPNAPPKSWEEMYEYAKKLTKEGRYGIEMPAAKDLGWVMWGFQAMKGEYLLNDNWDAADVNNDYYRDLFTIFRKIYQENLTIRVASSSYKEITPLGQGKVAMQLSGSWAMGQLKNDYPDKVDDIGYAVCPTWTGETEGVTTAALGGWGFSLDGNAKHPEEAGAFIEWLLAGDPEYMYEFFKELGFSKFTARKSVDELLNTREESKNDAFRAFTSEHVLPYAVAEPCYPWAISKEFADSLNAVEIMGTIDVDKTLASLQSKLEGIIESDGLAGTNPRYKAEE